MRCTGDLAQGVRRTDGHVHRRRPGRDDAPTTPRRSTGATHPPRPAPSAPAPGAARTPSRAATPTRPTGTFTITTTIKDVGGSQTVAICQTVVFAFAPGGGAFAIGDRNAATGTTSPSGALSGRRPTSSVAAEHRPRSRGSPRCRLSQPAARAGAPIRATARHPRTGRFPRYMGVIVTSSTTKSGSKISGDTAHIVVVKVDSGLPAQSRARRDRHRRGAGLLTNPRRLKRCGWPPTHRGPGNELRTERSAPAAALSLRRGDLRGEHGD